MDFVNNILTIDDKEIELQGADSGEDFYNEPIYKMARNLQNIPV